MNRLLLIVVCALCGVPRAGTTATVRVHQSDAAAIRLTITPSVDDTVWRGWVGLPPRAEIAGVKAVAHETRPSRSKTDEGVWLPSVDTGASGLIRHHRVVPVRVALTRPSHSGEGGNPGEVEITLWLKGAVPPMPVRGRGLETLLSRVVVNWEQARAWTEATSVPDPPEPVPAPSVRLVVEDEGLYRLTYDDLDAAIPGSGPIDARGIAVWNGGGLIPIRVVSVTGTWGPGDWIEFYAHGTRREDAQGRWTPVEGKYSRFNHYFFLWNENDPPRIRDMDAAPHGETPASYHWWSCHNEVNSYPSISGHRGAIDDDWYWGGPFYPGELERSFTISDLVREGPRGQIRARFLAISDVDTVAVDHAVNLLVNGNSAGSASWGGYGAEIVNGAEVGLVDGQNLLTIQSVGNPISGLLLDYFAMLYPRRYVMSGGQTMFGPAPSGAEYRVAGFDPGETADVVEVTTGTRLTGLPAADHDGTIGFYAVLPDTARILVVPASSWMGASDLAATPSPVVPRPPLADGSRAGQFTVIYGSDELEAADGFRDLHLQRGDASSAEIVHTDDVWDEFSYGVLDPRALRWFLQWAFAHWAAPPEFVLLLGDGTWDYNRYLGQGASSNVVPSYGNPASDNFYASLNDTVFYPDLYVGRIPSQDGTQAATALAKAQAYLDAPSYDIWRKRSLFVTGGATAGDFSLYGTWVNVLYNVLIAPPPFIGTKITVAKNVENYWPGFYNSSIRAAIDSGCVVVNFFGHGATGTWDYMLESEDAALLANGTRMPFIVSPTCFTGDFADPRDTVFAEHFLRLDGAQHGAIGFFGSSGTSYLAEGFEYAWALFSSLLRQGDPRMGPAVNAAKFSSFPWPTSTDSIMASVYNLLGDPLLPLAFPLAPDLHVNASGLSLSPAQPAASDSMTLVATVINEGIAWTSPVAATLRRDGAMVANATFTPDSLQSRIRFRWKAGDSPGIEELLLTLDSSAVVPDPDAGDNALAFQIVLLRPRPLLLMPAADAMLARPQVECIASPAAEEPHTFQVATSDAFGSTVIDSAAGVSPVAGLVTWTWQAPSAGAFCWRARVDGGAWSIPRWFTVAPSDSGWAQSDPAQLAALAFSGCETSAQGLRLIETVSGRDYALLAEGAFVDTVSSYNANACGPENLIGGTTVNTDWGGAFYFLREDQDQWALIDLGRERMIKRLASAHEGQALTKRSVWSYFGIESSADGIEFVDWGHTPDYTDSGYGPWISSYITYDAPDPIPVRYIRFRYGKCYPFGPVYEGSRVYEVYAFSAAYPDSGWALSLPIGPAASWASLASAGVTPPGTNGVVQVLLPGPGDSWETAGEAPLGLTGSLTWLDAATNPVIRLRALLSSVPRDVTPRLTSWQVAYATIPDLRIEPDTVRISPPVPEPGSGARVRARIVNTGSAAVAAARYQLTASENGGAAELLQDAFAPWLAPGASESVDVAWEAVPGVSLFELTVDPMNAVAEADEGNNRAAGSARVLGNLAWSDSVAVSPASPAPGETLAVGATAVNNGVLTVGQTMASCRWLAGGDSSAGVVPPMEPGQSAGLQWRIAVPHTGATSLALTLDPDSLVQEVTRDDNVRLVPVTVTELADPAILSVGTECATPPIGDPFAITVELVNAGGRPTGDMLLACTQAGGWTEHVTVPSMAAGESTSVAVLWPTGDLPATLSFLFVLDPDSLVADQNRLNNTAGIEVTTLRAPDLALQSTAVEPPVPVAGRAVTLTTTIRNRGIEGSPGFVVRLRDETVREQTVPDLGGQRTTDLHWSLTPGVPGDMVLSLELDALGTVAEACEGNNTAAISVPVGIPWDLVMTEEDLQRVDPGAPFVAWDSLELAITVHNAGDEEAPSALVGLYDGLAGASGVLVSSAHTASLSAGGVDTLRVWWPAGTTPGVHVLSALIDPRGDLEEWNVTNNQAVRSIEVLADTIPPGLEIAPPWAGFQSGGYLSADDTLVVRAWDTASGIASLTLLLDGAPFDHPAMAPDTSTGTRGFLLAVPAAGPPGAHVMMARAADRVGLTAEAQISYVLPGGLLVSDVAAVPSPASGPTWITARVSMSGDLRAAIYTPAGRLIRMLDGRVDYPGRAGLEWDLLDHDGDRVANGAYLVHLTLRTGTASASAKGSLVVRR